MSLEKPNSQREILEAALAANPDDTAAHSAYADLLTEERDPRGEFISVQLALETATDPAQREKLLGRQTELLIEHADEWLGALAEPLHDVDLEGVHYLFRRGWLDELQLPSIRAPLAELLADSPAIRLLRQFLVVNPDAQELDLAEAYTMHVLAGVAWFEEDEEEALVPLQSCEYLANVRRFQLGDHTHERCDVGDGPIADMVEKMTRLEELHLYLWKFEDAERVFGMKLPHLKLLHIGGVFSYPIADLAANESLGALEDIRLQPASPRGHQKLWPDECAQLVQSPYLKSLKHLRLSFLVGGDVFCEALVESGLLAQLETLELLYSEVTDAGAALLAASPDFAKLKVVNLVGNQMTTAAIEPLRAANAALIWEPQTEPGEASEEIVDVSMNDLDEDFDDEDFDDDQDNEGGGDVDADDRPNSRYGDDDRNTSRKSR